MAACIAVCDRAAARPRICGGSGLARGVRKGGRDTSHPGGLMIALLKLLPFLAIIAAGGMIAEETAGRMGAYAEAVAMVSAAL